MNILAAFNLLHVFLSPEESQDGNEQKFRFCQHYVDKQYALDRLYGHLHVTPHFGEGEVGHEGHHHQAHEQGGGEEGA